MTGSIILEYEAHSMLMKKQAELYLKTNKRRRLADIASEAIVLGIEGVGDNDVYY